MGLSQLDSRPASNSGLRFGGWSVGGFASHSGSTSMHAIERRSDAPILQASRCNILQNIG